MAQFDQPRVTFRGVRRAQSIAPRLMLQSAVPLKYAEIGQILFAPLTTRYCQNYQVFELTDLRLEVTAALGKSMVGLKFW